MNKFYVKDVEWVRDETFFVKVNHLPSRVSIKVDGINFNVSSGEWTQSVLSALHQLQEKVNKHYEEKENEIEQKQSENDEVNVTKSMIDNQMDIRPLQSNKMLSYDEQAGTRLKVLDLACSLYNTAYYDRSEGNKPIIDIAKRFYDYIIKGE